MNVVEGELIPDETIRENSPGFLEQLNLYKSKLAENKRLTYDRMVSLAVENLEKKPDTLQHIRYLLVDEYQDINRAQEKLIQLIGRNAGIFVVGDPRQTIYKWRGSDEACFAPAMILIWHLSLSTARDQAQRKGEEIAREDINIYEDKMYL